MALIACIVVFELLQSSTALKNLGPWVPGPRVLGSLGPRSSGPGSSVYSVPCRFSFLRKHCQTQLILISRRMKVIAVSICVAFCLRLTVGQVQLRVYRGTLVHSRVLEQIEVLEDHLLGFDENNLGEVSTCIVKSILMYICFVCVVFPMISCGLAKHCTRTFRLEVQLSV